jgi:quinol monooxygenase YgiN
MATILAHITVREGAEREFEEIARGLFGASHAAEPGLVRYEYWRGEAPRTYYTLLSFVDFAAFIEHQASDHHETASPAIGRLVEKLRLEWVDPVAGAAPMGESRPMDLSGDQRELVRKYARLFAVREAEWWDGVRTGAN